MNVTEAIYTDLKNTDLETVLNLLCGEHSYSMETNDVMSSERTRGLAVCPSDKRNPETVDARFMARAGNMEEVLRPVECMIGYGAYRRTLHLATESANELIRAAERFYSLPFFLADYDGAHLPIAWPENKVLRLTSTKNLGYEIILANLRREYPLCEDPLEALGVIITPGQSIFSDMHPVLLLSLKGHVLVHMRGRPIWSPDYDPETDGEQLYLVADNLKTFGRDGLSRCDAIYTDGGGVPYAMPEDIPLKEVTSVAPRNSLQIMRILDKWQGHIWCMTGCPGMLKDRLFIVSNDAPSYVKESLKEKYGTKFGLIGRIARCKDDHFSDCEVFILMDAGGTVYAYVPDTCKVRKIAQSFDSFCRIGTRRLYFNFQVPSSNTCREFDDPTFYTQPGSGFFLLSRELISVRRVRTK
uniref:Protein U95 n=1 Tax=Mastomys natalensis cytomegalovirus 1 TaxID=2973541 RepID=A0A9Y1IJM2_9BETA|nr:protein U95 [Mastomys natalensis cytomegalovirus 1]WEG68980.1 protein U95 [Mastomys natalensis cytomegalovirus 1]WEG71208.1 protein U95 [Mastomys natalensis cytomegalovirus 1]